MRLVPVLVLTFASAGTAALAAGPPSAESPALTASVRSALHSMIAPGQAARKIDPDQGDDNAALRAITVVCGHDNPSATRSAICPTPVSPD
jgi:hypothetical protein